MEIIRVVIVDDSAFVRKVVREMLSSCAHIEVVGMAGNGCDALQMVEELQPDVVTCDLLMPELDGVGFVRQQMERRPLPILILTASPQDAERVLEALDAGAVDFIQKPTALANDQLLLIRETLVEKVSAAAQAPSWALSRKPAPPAAVSLPARASLRVDIVVLGVSTGGPQALRYLLPQLAADFPAPLVMVLHMPTGYTALFAQKLDEISHLRVKEATEGCAVLRSEALLAPAGRHLSFQQNADDHVTVKLSIQPLNKPHRPSVDVLFQSAAEIYGSRVLGVVMTGMGDDGKKGAAAIKAQGGTVLTESEESCIIYGMPRSVVEAGYSDASVPLASLAEEINKRV
jgi:two-component system, chemotaxis family, protein-glutamate methylesterase/glutaminase